jgi:uncharacterized membrane protein YdjX (TVP38/TMEM64 family)
VRRETVKFVVFIGLMVSLLGLAIGGWATGRISRESVEALVEAGGPLSPVLFVVVATLLPIAWIPRMMTSIVAGAMFGFWLGALLALAGGFGGAISAYYMGHWLGHDFVMKKIGVKGKGVVDFLARNGFIAIALGRINPVMNCEAISLGSGLMGLPMRIYIPSTLAGMAPGSLLYSAFGSSVLTEDAAWGSVISATAAVLMTVATGWWLWVLWRRDKRAREKLAAAQPTKPAENAA